MKRRSTMGMANNEYEKGTEPMKADTKRSQALVVAVGVEDTMAARFGAARTTGGGERRHGKRRRTAPLPGRLRDRGSACRPGARGPIRRHERAARQPPPHLDQHH